MKTPALPLDANEHFEAEILNNEFVANDPTCRMAFQFWRNGDATMKRVLLALVRHLATEKRYLLDQLVKLKERQADVVALKKVTSHPQQ